MQQDKQLNCEFSHCYVAFQVIAANPDWNLLAVRTALAMWLSGEMNHSFTYSNIPEEISGLVTVSHNQENWIQQ